MKDVFIISAPSGTGKNSLIDALLEKRADLSHSISTTTREPRSHEIEGEHYYFIASHKFRSMIRKDEFLEWAEVLDNFYGTTNAEIQRIRSAGRKPVLDLDVQGALNVKRKHNEVVTIFILPPSIDELYNRLKKRGTETEQEIEKRVKLARNEIKFKHLYDHQVINDDFDTALAELDQLLQ